MWQTAKVWKGSVAASGFARTDDLLGEAAGGL
jgi:hypothetical protein